MPPHPQYKIHQPQIQKQSRKGKKQSDQRKGEAKTKSTHYPPSEASVRARVNGIQSKIKKKNRKRKSRRAIRRPNTFEGCSVNQLSMGLEHAEARKKQRKQRRRRERKRVKGEEVGVVVEGEIGGEWEEASP